MLSIKLTNLSKYKLRQSLFLKLEETGWSGRLIFEFYFETLNKEGALEDWALIEAVRKGNKLAFKQIVEKYQDLVARTAFSMLGHGQEAEDVGQETFIRFYKSMGNFKGEAALGTYLTRISINLCLDALKRRRRNQRWLGVFSRETDAVDEPDFHEKRRRESCVQQVLLKLNPRHRALIVLRYYHGYSLGEIAGILKVPEGTVFSRLSRAHGKLKQLLDGEDVQQGNVGGKALSPT